jgi:hypothetical protein
MGIVVWFLAGEREGDLPLAIAIAPKRVRPCTAVRAAPFLN